LQIHNPVQSLLLINISSCMALFVSSSELSKEPLEVLTLFKSSLGA